MMVLPDELIDRARALDRAGSLSSWPGALLDERLPELRRRIEAGLQCVPGPVREHLLHALGRNEDLALGGLAQTWCAAVAGAAGWSVVDATDRALVVERGSDRAVVLTVPVPGPAQALALQAELERRLAGIFDGRAWALVLRQPLPPDADLDRVLEPVRMWLVAVDRGRWDGDYAIYEDAGVSLELRLLEGDSGAPGPHLRVPAVGVEHLALQVEAHARSSLEDIAGEFPGLPRILALVRGARWSLPRRQRMELFYGKLLESTSDGPELTVTFRRGPHGLYSRQPFDQVASTWWLSPDAEDPLTPRGFADTNPWCETPGGPRFPGRRLGLLMLGDLGELHVPATLRLEHPKPGGAVLGAP